MGKLYPIIHPFFLQIAIHDVYRQLFGGYYHYIYIFFSFFHGWKIARYAYNPIHFSTTPPQPAFFLSHSLVTAQITETSYSPLDILPNEMPLSLSRSLFIGYVLLGSTGYLSV